MPTILFHKNAEIKTLFIIQTRKILEGLTYDERESAGNSCYKGMKYQALLDKLKRENNGLVLYRMANEEAVHLRLCILHSIT